MSSGKKTPPPPSATPAVQAVQEKTPFQLEMERRFKEMTDFNAKPGRDILDAPGMSSYFDIYGTATDIEKSQRFANPMRALSGPASGNYQAQLDQLTKQKMYDTRARGLSDAFAGLQQQALGFGGTAAELDMNRRGQFADLMLQQQEAYYNRPKKKPWWQTVGEIAVGGLTAYFKP